MFAALGSLIAVVTTLVPLIYTAVKVFPRVKKILSLLFSIGRGTVGPGNFRSGLIGLLLFVFTFVGGFLFFVSIYMGWGLEVYLAVMNVVFTPFAYIAENFIRSFISQLPNLPPNAASVVCLFDFGTCFTLLTIGFASEVFMRIIIYFLLRRGK